MMERITSPHEPIQPLALLNLSSAVVTITNATYFLLIPMITSTSVGSISSSAELLGCQQPARVSPTRSCVSDIRASSCLMGPLSARLMLMWGQRANLAAIIIVMIAELLIAAHIRHTEQNENRVLFGEIWTRRPA